jgi:hypothetical protein
VRAGIVCGFQRNTHERFIARYINHVITPLGKT